MSDKIDNPYVYPGEDYSELPEGVTSGHVQLEKHHGMTLRDYFAAKYLNGIISNPQLLNVVTDRVDGAKAIRTCVADNAYAQADEMLKARGNE